NIVICSLLALLAVEVGYSLLRFSTFLAAQVLTSLALAMGCIVFIASWHVSGADSLNAQVNWIQWMQLIVIMGIILVFLVIIICLPYREGDEVSHTVVAYH